MKKVSMPPLEELIRQLESGNREEKGRAITELARLKDPRAFQALRDVAGSADPELSFMALYTLALSGDSEAMEAAKDFFSPENPFIREMLSFAKSLSGPENRESDPFVLAVDMGEVFNLINQCRPNEAREKILALLCVNEGLDIPGAALFGDFYKLGLRRNAGMLTVALGMAEMQLGKLDEAIELSNKALEIGQELGDGQIIMVAIGNLGVACMEMDRYYEALGYFHESLDLMESFIDPWRKKNRVLHNLSALYYRIGDPEKALEHAEKALETARLENDTIGLGWGLNTLGISLAATGRFEEAERVLKKALSQCESNGDRNTQALALSNLGFASYNRDEHAMAREYLSRALDIFKKTGNISGQVTAFGNLAYSYLLDAKAEDARRCAEESLRLARETDGQKDDAEAHYILGTVCHYYDQDPGNALGHYKAAIDIYEKIRQDIGIDDLKISFAENSASCYAQMIGLCVEIGRTDEAFEYAERSKSRALVELLSKAMDGIGSGKISDEEMAELKRLGHRLAFLKKRLKTLYGSGDGHGGARQEASPSDAGAVYSKIQETERQYMDAYDAVKRIDPEFASFTAVEPIEVEDVQAILDRETVFVEYYLTVERTFIFVVSAEGGVRVFTGGIDTGEGLERLSLMFESLSGAMVHDIASHDFYRDVKLPLSDLYELLLRPIEDAIKDARRLVIAPHLMLHYLPFHALYDRERKEHLIDRFEVAYAPCAEVLKFCRVKNDTTRESVAVFANPTGDLPYAEEEARRIADCFGPNQKIHIGGEATLANLESLGEVDILHLACHGIFRSDEPVFSNLLLADEHGACFLPDIFNLRLRGATLVTLSACESGLNRFSSGDELVGFARGFFYAGAPSVMASLWRVSDRSTADLMGSFYRNLRNMLPKSKALQLAMQELKSRPEYSHPFFWAPFVLMGDWV